MTPVAASERVRLDRWLWAARFFKTRGLAAEAIDGGKVQVNGERAKRAKQVGVNDTVRVRQGPYEFLVVVLGLAERRGSAAVAAEMYHETPESREAREKRALELKSVNAAFVDEAERPTKRDRRRLEKFRRDRGWE
jgi:ribosome-associated heat shock protein Hsp15